MDGLTSSEPSNPGIDAGNKFDHLNEFYDSQQCVPSTAATSTVGGEWPAGIAISRDPLFMDDQIDTTFSLYASPISDGSPSADQQLTFLGFESTPYSISSFVDYAATPESVAALKSERDTSPYYMTPPSPVGSPFGFQPIDPRRPFSSNSMCSHAVDAGQSVRGSQEQGPIFRRLQCCRFRKNEKDSPGDKNWGILSNDQISRTLKTWDYLLPWDPLGCVRELPEKNACMPIRQVLGLPEVWEGVEGAVNYFRVLEADMEDLSKLGPLARRFAQIFLYLNYEMLYMDCRDTVISRVLDACHDDPNIAQTRDFRRNRFSGVHVRRGRWWWRLAASLGFGILLVADDQLIRTLYVCLLTLSSLD